MYSLRVCVVTILMSLALLPSISSALPLPPLRFATLNYPPFIYEEDHQAKGVIADIVREAFKRLQQPIVIAFYPVPRGLLLVNNGNVDGYFSLKKTPAREEKLLYTRQPLIRQTFVLFVRHESTLQYSGIVEDLAPYRIGVVSQTSYGSLFDNAVREKKLLKLDEARDFISNFKKLLAGRVDMVINSYDVGMALVNELQQQDNVKVLDPPVETVESYLAFTRQRNFQRLADDFDSVLQQMIADGTVEHIKRRYPAAVSIGY